MTNKASFIFHIIGLMIARVLDFYSTSLWFFSDNGRQDETSLLVDYMGLGWNQLLLLNTILITVLVFGMFHYFFKSDMKYIGKQKNFKTYISNLYYNQPDTYWYVIWKPSKNRVIYITHFAVIISRVFIVASILAFVHNMSQFSNISYYNHYRNLVVRPLYVIYAIIGISFIIIILNFHKEEFRKYIEKYA